MIFIIVQTRWHHHHHPLSTDEDYRGPKGMTWARLSAGKWQGRDISSSILAIEAVLPVTLLNCKSTFEFYLKLTCARTSNQSILTEISPEYSLEGLMLKLKLQYFGHLMWRLWCWERLKAGGEGDNSGWDGWMASPTQWTWVWVGSGSWWWTGKPGVLQSMGLQRVGHERLNSNEHVRTC